MARFVLVHGAFSDAWIWGPLTDQLKAAGHTVDAFDLPGLGDDNTPVAKSLWRVALRDFARCLPPTPNRRL